MMKEMWTVTYLGRNRRTLQLVNEIAHSLEVSEVGAVRIACILRAFLSSGDRIDQEFLHGTWVNLEVELASDRILPELFSK